MTDKIIKQKSNSKSVKDLNLTNWDTRPFEVVNLSKRGLTSLEGCPDPFNGSLNVIGNKLVTLLGSPQYIRGNFLCNNNQLMSLEGGPKKITGEFNISDNPGLKSLTGAPTECGSMHCRNTSITSLEGTPRIIMGDLILGNCANLVSLEHINTHIQQLHGNIWLYGTTHITSHILGVFLIKGIQRITVVQSSKDLERVAAIVNKHLVKGRAGLMDCQTELISAGFDDYAQI